MPGILDIFDSPDLLGNLFGIGQANAATPPPQAPPMPPPSVMQGAPPAFSPNSTMGGLASLGGGAVPPPELSFADRAQPVQEAISNGMMDPQGRNFTSFAPPPAEGPRRGVQLAGAGPGLPANDTPPLPPVNGGGSPAGPPPTLAPPSGAPPMPPRLAPGAAPPTMSGGGGLAASLGIPDARMQQFLAGVGKGASNLQGTGGFANAMRGAGGGITGAQTKETEQVAQKRQAQNDLFNQSSTAFKDWIAGENLGNQTTIANARAKYYAAQEAIKRFGGKDVFSGTPYAKARDLERMLDQWEDRERKIAQDQFKQSQADGDVTAADKAKQRLDNIPKERDKQREERAKRLGINPNEYKKGISKDDAFEADKLSPDQRLMIPDNAWLRYKDPENPKADKEGYVYKRRDWLQTPPHPDWKPGAQQQPQAPAQNLNSAEIEDANALGA